MNRQKHRLENARIMLALLVHTLICNVTTLKAIDSIADDHLRIGSDATAFNRDLCPSMCTCDTFKSLNRAKCSNQQLINANVGMSVFVELLDLSYNDITVLESSCFSSLKRLVSLQLDHNAIHSIDLDALSPLKELRIVSLSHNRLASFDKRIFEQNTRLTQLNLAGNNFMDWKNAPVIQSESLEELDLRESKLTHLHSAFFKELPNLRTLDLAKNLLITINVAAFERNHRLESVKIEGNPFTCDIQMEMTLLLMKRRSIKARLKHCPVPKVRQMFERMQMLPAPGEGAASQPARRQNVTTVWRNTNYSRPILNQVCPLNDTDRACDLFETCALEYSMLLKETEEKLAHTRPMSYGMEATQSWIHSITVNIAFYGGLCLGSIFGGSCIFICSTICVRGCKSQKDVERENRRRYRGQTNREDHRHMRLRIQQPRIEPIGQNQLTPVTPPPSPQPEVQQPSNRDIVEYRHPAVQRRSQNSFFSLLFERPARRRAYRQLNRNATNLVRRLSQSRLFVNSSRAQRNRNQSEGAARSPTAAASVEQPQFDRQASAPAASTSTVLSVPHGLHASSSSLPSLQRDFDFQEPTAPSPYSTDEDGYTSEPDLGLRTETPPPAYQDILPDDNAHRRSISERHSF